MFEEQKKPEGKMNYRDDKQYQDSPRSPAVLLANSFQMLIEEAVEQMTRRTAAKVKFLYTQLAESMTGQQQMLEEMNANLVHFGTELSQLATKQKQTIYSQQNIQKQLETLISQNRLLENASKENRLLSQDHYQQCIIEPMARSLFAVFDDIENAKRRCRETGQMNSPPICDIFDGIFIHLRQFLSIYQVEPVKHRPNSKFDPKVMRPVKIIATENKDLDNCVAKSLQTGFRWREGRLLRPESVAVYKYEEPLNNNFDEKERSQL